MSGKIQKPCKICGKMFTPCTDCENDKTMFRWKRIACSQKCAKEYFAKVEASRQPKFEGTYPQPVKIENAENNNTVSEYLTVAEDIKPKRAKKNRIKIEESEQID